MRNLAGGGAKWVVVTMLIYSLANVTWMGTLRSGQDHRSESTISEKRMAEKSN